MRKRLIAALAAITLAAFFASGYSPIGRAALSTQKSGTTTIVSSDEKKVVGAINHQRLKSKLQLLQLDYDLCGIAQQRADKYLTMQSYHDDIEGLGRLSDMVSGLGLKALSLDEYVSRSAPEKAVSNWMSSGGGSVTDTQFTHTGCGIAKDGDKSLVVVIFAKLDIAPTPTPVPTPTPTPAPIQSPEPTPAPSQVQDAINSAPPEPTASGESQRVTGGSPTSAEIEFLNTLNKQRKANNIRELVFEENAQKAAQFRAWEVADTAKYSSDSPAYGDLKSVLKQFGVPYKSCAQALTRGGDGAVSAYNALIKSPTYRKILMSKDFAYAGVGISSRGSELIYVIYFTN